MTEFGVVDFTSRAWFHGHIYDSTPHPEVPALPVVPLGATLDPFYATADGRRHVGSPAEVFKALAAWVKHIGGQPVFVSDNPGFDWMWIADGFDRAGLDNPFGHSSRRIGDLAAGLSGNWRRTSAWKKLRKTRHDHNPVNDSLGNAEALDTLLTRHRQQT